MTRFLQQVDRRLQQIDLGLGALIKSVTTNAVRQPRQHDLSANCGDAENARNCAKFGDKFIRNRT